MAKQKVKERPDKRKIPDLFKAIAKNFGHDHIGFLMHDEGGKFHCFSVKDSEGSIFKERVLNKRDYFFSEMSVDDFYRSINAVLHNMKKSKADIQMELEAKDSEIEWAKAKLEEIMDNYV